jgi:hypothetical protein
MPRSIPIWLLAFFFLGLGASHAVRIVDSALAATVTVEPSVPAELKDQGCRLGNSVVPKAAGPAVATICDKREEVMKGFLMQGPERIAVCCPIPTGK